MIFTNRGQVDGTFKGSRFTQKEFTAPLVVDFTSEQVTFVKEVDKTVWESGNLTYTIKITNDDTAESLTGVTITDTLDTNVELVSDSVTITINQTTDNANFAYDDTATPNKTIKFGSNTALIIPAGQACEIIFQVSKVPVEPET